MARLYKTASANPLDYMYKLNVPLMEKVIEANDSYITDNLTQLSGLDTAATQFPFLKPDEQRAKEISDEYSSKIDKITSAIRNDPANWRSQMEGIRGLSKDLQSSYKTGEISKIAGNYSKYKQVSDYIDDQVKEYGKSGKGISADRAKAYKQYFMNNFVKANPAGTAYNPQTGEYNAMDTFDPMANIDVRKMLSEELDKMKADGEVRITDNLTGSGEYFNKETKKWEGITPERILRIVSGRINNPQLMDYLRQDTMAGILTGVFNTDPNSPEYGKFIAPYNYNKVGINSAEQAQLDAMKKQIDNTKNPTTKQAMQAQLDEYIKQLGERTRLDWNSGSYLAPIMKSIVDQYSYSKDWEENDLSPNSIWSTKYSQQQANWRNSANIKAREDADNRKFSFQKEMYNRKRTDAMLDKLIDFNLDMAKEGFKAGLKTKSKTTGTGKASATSKSTSATTPNSKATFNGVIPAKTNTDNMVLGQIYTNPFYYTTEEKSKMVTKLGDEISVNKNYVSQLEKTLANLQKTNPDNKIMIANAQNQIVNAKAQLATLESQRNLAVDYAINKWKTEKNTNWNEGSEELIRKYLAGNTEQEYKAANSEFLKVEAERLRRGLSNNPGVVRNNSGNNDVWMRTVYYPARQKKAQAEARHTGAERLFNSDVKSYANDKLAISAKETTNRSDIIQTTPEQDKVIIAMINSSPHNYKIVNSEGKEINLSFEHGTATTNPEKFNITGIASTTGLGDKGIEIPAIINGKNVIIIPKDDGGKMQGYIADQFKKSNVKEVKEAGSILSSPTASTLSDMITEMRMNTNSAFGTKDAWTYRVIPNPANPLETVRIRSRNISTGSSEPKWEFQVEVTGDSYFSQMPREAGVVNHRVRGVDFDVDDSGIIKGFVPLKSTKSNNGIYHNLEDVIGVFPSH